MKEYGIGVLAGMIAAMILVTTFWKGCGVEPIDREMADSLAIVTSAHQAGYDSAKVEIADFLESLPDSAEMAARDEEIRAAGRSAERRARARATANADNLREALDKALMENWIPVLDEILAAKDEEREAAVATERLITQEWQDSYNRLFAGVESRVDSLTAHADRTIFAKDIEIAFYKSEAERLESIPRFQVKAPAVIAVGVALGFLASLAI